MTVIELIAALSALPEEWKDRRVELAWHPEYPDWDKILLSKEKDGCGTEVVELYHPNDPPAKVNHETTPR